MIRITPPPLCFEPGREVTVIDGPEAGRTAYVVGPGTGADGLLDLDVVKIAYAEPIVDGERFGSFAEARLAKKPWPSAPQASEPRSKAIPGSWIGPNGFRRKR